MAVMKHTLGTPRAAGSLLRAVRASDTRAHAGANIPARRVRPKPYVPLGKGGR